MARLQAGAASLLHGWREPEPVGRPPCFVRLEVQRWIRNQHPDGTLVLQGLSTVLQCQSPPPPAPVTCTSACLCCSFSSSLSLANTDVLPVCAFSYAAVSLKWHVMSWFSHSVLKADVSVRCVNSCCPALLSGTSGPLVPYSFIS